MNYRRGLLRLWLIASVLWIAFTGWLYASEIATALQSPPVVEEIKRSLNLYDKMEMELELDGKGYD